MRFASKGQAVGRAGVVVCGKYDTYMHEQMGVEFPPDTALVPALEYPAKRQRDRP